MNFINLFQMSKDCRISAACPVGSSAFGAIYCLAIPAQGQGTQPIVAIHDSELTRALESMPAPGRHPPVLGPLATVVATQWQYFVMPDSVKEMLRSDGTTFTVVGDSNIVAGVLTNVDGSPKYPIVISLASEAIRTRNCPVDQLCCSRRISIRRFIGFHPQSDGTTRDRFCLAKAMGVNMVNPGLTNWGLI